MVSTHQLARAIFPLTIDGAITLGRADNNAIVIPESAASRLHAEIMGARGSWTVRDQSSANGTWVNGERVREAVLQNGDYLRVGTVDFRFFLGPPAAAADDGAEATEAFEAMAELAAAPPKPGAQGPTVLMDAAGAREVLAVLGGTASPTTAPPKSRAGPTEIRPRGLPSPDAAPDLQPSRPRVNPAAPATRQPDLGGPPPPRDPASRPEPARDTPRKDAPRAADLPKPPSLQPAPGRRPGDGPTSAAPAASARAVEPAVPARAAESDGDSAPRPEAQQRIPSFHVRGGGAAIVPKEEYTPPRPQSSGSGMGGPAVLIVLVVLLLGGGSIAGIGWFIWQGMNGTAPAPVVHTANPEATRLIAEGKRLFSAGRGFDAAAQFYSALKVDPQNAEAERLGYAVCEFITLDQMAQSLPTAPIDGEAPPPEEIVPAATEPAATPPETPVAAAPPPERRRSEPEPDRTASVRIAPVAEPVARVTTPPPATTTSRVAQPTAAPSAEVSGSDRALNYILESGQREFDKGNLAKAVQKWETLLAADPSRSTPQYYQAEEKIRAAKDKMKAQSKDMYAAALTLMKSGQWKAARVQLEKTLAVDPYNEAAEAKLADVRGQLASEGQDLYNQGRTREEAGDKDSAIDYYQQVIDLLGSGDSLAQKASKRISALKE